MHELTQLQYATFWQRLAAVLIDTVIMFIAFIPLGIIFGFLGNTIDTPFYDISMKQIISLIVYCIFWMKFGATPGKMLMNIKIINKDNEAPLSFGTAIIRYIGYFVSIFFLGIGFLWMLWDEDSQCWQDKMANTVVVQLEGDIFQPSQTLE